MPSVMATYRRADVAFERGEGAYLFDTQGRRYLDFMAGVAVSALGHCHPALVQVLTDQAGKLWHTSNLFRIPGQEIVAGRLAENSFAELTYFCNSGAEAIETGLKLVRRFHTERGEGHRYRIVTTVNGFHGRTTGAIAAGGQEKLFAGFGPLMPGFDRVPFGDADATEAAIGPETAGILIEPVQGEGGVLPASPDYLRRLRALADAHGLLLFLDEVQTGIGRTGHLFAYQAAGIEPDILAAAKGLGAGFPVAACLATARVGRVLTPGTHGSTLGGNPLAMRVAAAVLDQVLAPGFLEHVRVVGDRLRQALDGVVARHPAVFRAARGVGLMLGLGCVLPNTVVADALRADGLLLAGAGGNVLRVLPPLIIQDAHVQEAVAILDRTASRLEAEAIGQAAE